MISKARWGVFASAFYFFNFASEVCVTPFFNVYMRSRGVTKQQLGVISAVRPWVGVAAALLWPATADYFSAHRVLLLLLLVTASATRLPLPFLNTFVGFFAVAVARECLASAINVMADSAVSSGCTKAGEYGAYRMWGTIGWGGMSTLAGLIWDWHGVRSALAVYFALMAPCIWFSWHLWRRKVLVGKAGSKQPSAGGGLDSPGSLDERLVPPSSGASSPSVSGATGSLHHRADPSNNEALAGEPNAGEHDVVLEPEPAKPPAGFLAKLLRIFGRAESLAFFWAAVVMGFGMGMIDSYLFLLLKDMGASDTLLGLALTVMCCAEAPIFQLQGFMIRWLGSADALINVALVAYTVRMLFYSQLPQLSSPWWVLPVELLHGLTFGCGWGAGCEKCRTLAPLGLEATQQGVFQAVHFGLGYGLGGLVGGWLSQRYGIPTMFSCGAMVVAAGGLLALLARRLTSCLGGSSSSPWRD